MINPGLYQIINQIICSYVLQLAFRQTKKFSLLEGGIAFNIFKNLVLILQLAHAGILLHFTVDMLLLLGVTNNSLELTYCYRLSSTVFSCCFFMRWLKKKWGGQCKCYYLMSRQNLRNLSILKSASFAYFVWEYGITSSHIVSQQKDPAEAYSPMRLTMQSV